MNEQRKQPAKVYDEAFYQLHKDPSLNAAKVIAPIVLEVYPVKSVIDVGCGTGAWLSIFQSLGVDSLAGYEGSDLAPDSYQIDKKNIVTNVDFSSPDFKIGRKADLLLCLEVVEHLPASISTSFIGALVESAPVILFSAAIPGQTGVNHINEQPIWYWREIFEGYKYIELDFIRPRIWNNPHVAWWYRQNITTFIHRDLIESNPSFLQLSQQYAPLSPSERLVLVNERILRAYLIKPSWKLVYRLLKMRPPKP